jgi:hypothetical protein
MVGMLGDCVLLEKLLAVLQYCVGMLVGLLRKALAV